MPGITDSTTISAPQNSALGTPATAKAMPARVPCSRPITAVPFSVARVTERNLSSSRRSSASSSGRYQRMRSTSRPPCSRKKYIAYSMMPSMNRKLSVPLVTDCRPPISSRLRKPTACPARVRISSRYGSRYS